MDGGAFARCGHVSPGILAYTFSPVQKKGTPVRTRVKICGLTDPASVAVSVASGADAIGLVFYPPSPRAVSLAQARMLVQGLPPYVQAVGLFVDATPAQVVDAVTAVGLDLLQFHGRESPAYCAEVGQLTGRRWYRALSVQPGLDLHREAQAYQQAGASALLLDAWHPQLQGGTGQTFDWSLWPVGLDLPLILAGGLTPENVAEAIRLTRPYAVDVSGGVEQGKGIKSPERIKAFLAGVQQANGH